MAFPMATKSAGLPYRYLDEEAHYAWLYTQWGRYKACKSLLLKRMFWEEPRSPPRLKEERYTSCQVELWNKEV